MRKVVWTAVLCLVAACGEPATSGRDGDAGGADASPGLDGGAPLVDGGGTDAHVPPMPEDRDPCATGTCWENGLPVVRCGRVDHDEDYSTGDFNVHAYTTSLWAGTGNIVEVVRTGGSWQPAVIVVTDGGEVLWDGSVGLVSGGITVTGVADGSTGDRVEVHVETDTDTAVTVYVTGWSVVDGGFEPFLPREATYDVSVESRCEGMVTIECVVNGHDVDEPACGWLHHVAREVVPLLEGSREERLDDAATVAWWSLKEGVLFLDNPIVFSNCNFPDGDMRIGPLETCVPDRAWQVGLAAVQVTWDDLSDAESTAMRLFPGETSDEVLARTAREAGLDADDAAAVVASGGDLRLSWLLRTSAIGFAHQVGPVTSQCIDRSEGWCYGTGYPATRMFAPDRDAALGAIDDVRAILDEVAP